MGIERAGAILHDDPVLAEDRLDVMATCFIQRCRRAAEDVEVDCVIYREDFACNTRR